ncbi:MAG: hypothetical protein PVI21_02255 [Candidatus Woesebacteria bacterium]|jgi:hypothetical protein
MYTYVHDGVSIQRGMPVYASDSCSAFDALGEGLRRRVQSEGCMMLYAADIDCDNDCVVEERQGEKPGYEVLVMIHGVEFKMFQNGSQIRVPIIRRKQFSIIVLARGQEIQLKNGINIVYDTKNYEPKCTAWQQNLVEKADSSKLRAGEYVECLYLSQAYDSHGIPSDPGQEGLTQILAPGISVCDDTILGNGVPIGLAEAEDCIPVFGEPQDDNYRLFTAKTCHLGNKPGDDNVSLFGLLSCALDVPSRAWLIQIDSLMFRNPIVLSGNPRIIRGEAKDDHPDICEGLAVVMHDGDALAYHISGSRHAPGYISYVLHVTGSRPQVTRYLKWRAEDMRLRPDYYNAAGRRGIWHWLGHRSPKRNREIAPLSACDFRG